MRSQKKATQALRRQWAQVVEEGRALRFGLEPATWFQSYPTPEAREAAYEAAKAAGVPVLKVPSVPSPYK